MRKILYIIPLIIFSFTFSGGPPQGWYQQFMPDLGGRKISDIFFLDSLTGWAVTAYIDTDDTAYVLKTTNGGDNWQITHTRTGGVGFKRIYFLNSLTGFASGANDFNSYSGLSKSTDGGVNWISLNVPDPFVQFDDMYVLGEDTIWLTASSSITGGVFLTTNGGINWIQQGSFGSQNPTKIYMIDGNTGFISNSTTSILRKTTNSGTNWDVVSGATGFTDMQFIDFNTGWKASSGLMKKTTNGGLNWTIQQTQTGGYIQVSGILSFSNINSDTIWGTGGYVLFPNNQFRAILHRTTNGGANWEYQIPDTSIVIFPQFINFTDKNKGWAYDDIPIGIHTKVGGDTTFLSIKQLSTEIPTEFQLHQNYPNPFNPMTNINYELRIKSHVRLSVFDISGKLIKLLIDSEQSAGTYQYTFDGTGLTSGVYFYRLQTEDFTETKKMLLVK
jgi:hypothetical protein